VGAAHLQTVSLTQVRGQSPRIYHNRAEEVPSPSAKAGGEDRKRSVEGCSAWGCSSRERMQGDWAQLNESTYCPRGQSGPIGQNPVRNS